MVACHKFAGHPWSRLFFVNRDEINGSGPNENAFVQWATAPQRFRTRHDVWAAPILNASPHPRVNPTCASCLLRHDVAAVAAGRLTASCRAGVHVHEGELRTRPRDGGARPRTALARHGAKQHDARGGHVLLRHVGRVRPARARGIRASLRPHAVHRQHLRAAGLVLHAHAHRRHHLHYRPQPPHLHANHPMQHHHPRF